MKVEELRGRIQALEAKISQATTDVIEGRRPYAYNSLPSTATASAPSAHDTLEGIINRTHMISILTRPLKSLKFAKSIFPAQLYPSVSVRYGITHWAVETDGRVFEVRTEGWKGKSGKMRIREEDSICPEYTAARVERYFIGVGSSGTMALLRQMMEQMQQPKFRKYHFYTNNCQLIAAAMAVAGCDQPATGYKALILGKDLLFFNRNNPGDVLNLLDGLMPVERYYQFLTEVASDFIRMSQRRRSIVRPSLHFGLTQTQQLLTTTAQYTIFGLLYPFAVIVMIIEGIIEAEHDWSKQFPDQQHGPQVPGNLFGLRNKKAATPINYRPPRVSQESSSSQRKASRARPPIYTRYEWQEDSLQNSNERWICAMYGHSDY